MPLPVEPTRYDQSSPYSGGETGRSVDEYPVFSALAQRISYLHDQPGSAAVTGMGHGRGAVYLRPTQTSPDLDDIRKNPSRISLSNIIRDQQAGLQVSGESGHEDNSGLTKEQLQIKAVAKGQRFGLLHFMLI